MENRLISQIINFFGPLLSPVPESSLYDVELPEETKDFLLSVGLPPGGSLLLTFYRSGVTPPRRERQARFLIIGDDYGTKLGLKEHTGEVFSIGLGSISRFINSSILTMLLFLAIYLTEQPELREVTDEEVLAIVERMRATFRDIDARALADPENWWSVILEQTEQGLL